MNIFTQATIRKVRANTARRAAKARATLRSTGASASFSNAVTRDLIGRLLDTAAAREQIPLRCF